MRVPVVPAEATATETRHQAIKGTKATTIAMWLMRHSTRPDRAAALFTDSLRSTRGSHQTSNGAPPRLADGGEANRFPAGHRWERVGSPTAPELQTNGKCMEIAIPAKLVLQLGETSVPLDAIGPSATDVILS
jgi:hypothetical protein